jgi:uncharacterized protein (TIGR00645 family)
MLATIARTIENVTEYLIFASRWLQAIVYMGLVFGSAFYTFKFLQELSDLILNVNAFTEAEMMLAVLGLIDISMVMNLLVIVIIGGYSIFTSRIDFTGEEDRPQWLDHLDADRLKVKLSTSLASISGVHLLKSFIDLQTERRTADLMSLNFEIIIHLVFIVSAIFLARIAIMLHQVDNTHHEH